MRPVVRDHLHELTTFPDWLRAVKDRSYKKRGLNYLYKVILIIELKITNGTADKRDLALFLNYLYTVWAISLNKTIKMFTLFLYQNYVSFSIYFYCIAAFA